LIHKKKHIPAPDKDSNFYEGDDGLEKILRDENYPDPVHTIYDKVRNFLTKKAYSNDEKIKVNFENPTLLGGRDQNKEKENCAIILRE
jgi:CRISPR-associated protein Cpf1